jgi:GntR family transcriptional regulator, transcriptional repressor for pyruvate dehydrogenase complex
MNRLTLGCRTTTLNDGIGEQTGLLQRRTLTSQVIEYVLSLVKTGKVKPGQTLPTENELTAILGVSRTCVREALKSLEFLRLITIRPRIGAVVQETSSAMLLSAQHFSSDSVQNVDVLQEFRNIIEVGMVSLAAEKATEDDLLYMEKAIEAYKQEIRRGKLDCYTDMEFHKSIAAASKNAMAIKVWDDIAPRLAEVLTHTIHLPKVPQESVHDHLKILKAIKERNPQKARAAMRTHLKNADCVRRAAAVQLPETVPARRNGSSRPATKVAVPASRQRKKD